MTIVLVSSVCVLPSSLFTSTLPAPAMRPVPRCESILFFLSRNSTPLTLPSIASSLNFSSAARSSLGVLTPMPILANLCPASRKMRGMQQRLRGNAADVEAGATVGGALLDDRDLEAELRRANGADVAAGAGADDDEIVGHQSTLYSR